MNETQRQLHSYLENNQTQYFDLLRQMVAINSFTANPAGVNALGELTATAFAKLGFTAETIPSDNPNFGKHLILTRPGKSGRKIGLISHLDTVYPAEEEVRNHFSWRTEGDRIYGPGTVDIKGGTVMVYMILDALQSILPDVYDDITWVILLDASEEVDGSQFGNICQERLAGSNTLASLIFEGGYCNENRCKLVVARKGMAIYHVTAQGRASHAGAAHQQGASAILQMAEVIQRIGKLTDYDRELTFNVGKITGGTVNNRVPHSAFASVEMRAFSPEVYEEGVASMMALNSLSTVSSPIDGYPCRVNVEIIHQLPPWPRNERTDGLFALWQEASEELAVTAIPEERGGLSDGNYFWGQIPSLDGLGPSGGNAHCSERSEDGSKDQEYCLATSFVPKTMLNLSGILKLIEYHY